MTLSLKNLKGEKGDTGEKGETGATGPQGPAGPIATVTASAIESALGYIPSRDVHLYCDGSDIYYFDDQKIPLTYEEVKTLVEDENNNVYITDGYYSLHGKYKYDASITGIGESAIGFIGETQLEGEVYSWRIIVNENNEVKEDEIWLAKKSDVYALTDRVSTLESNLPDKYIIDFDLDEAIDNDKYIELYFEPTVVAQIASAYAANRLFFSDCTKQSVLTGVW